MALEKDVLSIASTNRAFLGSAVLFCLALVASPLALAATPTAQNVQIQALGSNGIPAAALVVLNATDEDFDALTYNVVDSPAHGTVAPLGSARFTYTPAQGFSGFDSFTYRANDGSDDSNLATVFVTVVGAFTVTQQGDDIDGTEFFGSFGAAVAASGDGSIVAVGAEATTVPGAFRGGQVRVFSRDGDDWNQLGSSIDGDNPSDMLGESVALSADGQILAVGIRFFSENLSQAGQVRIYRFLEGDWFQLGSAIDGEAADDESGRAIGLASDGLTVAIGADRNAGTADRAGHVRVFRFLANDWVQVGSDIDGVARGDFSGTAVSLSGDGRTVAVGANGHDNNRGHTRVFRLTNGDWAQIGADIDGEAADDRSGLDLGLAHDGNTLASGAISNSAGGVGAGHVRGYEFSGAQWTQLGQDIDGETEERAGTAVALSGNGRTLAIGGPGSTNANPRAGRVRVFRLTGNSWVQMATDIDGEALDDNAGAAVALSDDGLTVVVGADGNEGEGDQAGHVRVFKLGNFRPKALDGYAASFKSTADAPQSAKIVLEASDPELDPLTYSIVSGPQNGTLGPLTGAELVYAPNNDFVGVDSFTFRANDGNSTSGLRTVRVTVFDNVAARQLGSDIDGNPGDQSGYAVALSDDGQTVAVGRAPSDPGRVRVYRYNGAFWQPLGSEIVVDLNGDAFAISSDGSVVAVGDESDRTGGTRAGAVFVYKFINDDWELMGGQINGRAESRAGTSVALSATGHTLAMGAPDGGAGIIQVFHFDGMVWNQVGGDLSAGGGRRGSAVALSADGFVVAGGEERHSSTIANVGRVVVWRFDGQQWVQVGEDVEGRDDYELLGTALAISADGLTFAAAGRGDLLGVFDNTGNTFPLVRIYDFDGTSWIQRGDDILGAVASPQFPPSVALASDGQIVAAGFPGNPPNATGSVEVYEFVGDQWQPYPLSIGAEDEGDAFGHGVALSGDARFLATGARFNDDGGNSAGQARVYALTNTSPQISGTAATSVQQFQAYSFSPEVSDADPGSSFSFNILNRPAWASFDEHSGQLSGTPGAGTARTYRNIVISVTDNAGGTSSLPAFDLTVIADSDGDGLTDTEEADLGTNPNLEDSDGDGLTDPQELDLGTTPTTADTDGDGFSDGEEVDFETDPLSAESQPSASGISVILLKAAIDN